jgi:hypothetical protein
MQYAGWKRALWKNIVYSIYEKIIVLHCPVSDNECIPAKQ